MPVRKTQDKEDGFFGVIAITCFRHPDGSHKFAQTIRFDFLQRSTAYEQCDKLQDEIDADGDPARAYVIDHEGIVIRAGRTAYLPPDYFLRPQQTRRREA